MSLAEHGILSNALDNLCQVMAENTATASSVRINFMFIYLLFSLRKAVGGKNLHSLFCLQEGSKSLQPQPAEPSPARR